MKAIVISLFGILTCLNFSGCACKDRIVQVPQKCVVPHILQPVIDNQKYNEYQDIAAKVLKNYLAQKEYAERLLKAQAVCE